MTPVSKLVVFGASLVIGAGLAGCKQPATDRGGSGGVLLVINSNSPDSTAVGDYYRAKRKIPRNHICHIKCTSGEVIRHDLFDTQIRKPILRFLEDGGIEEQVDYIVLTRGIPIRTDCGWGVDSALTRPEKEHSGELDNPYFASTRPFSRREFGMYLVTRLDGRTLAAALALVDRSLAAKPEKGGFLFDIDPRRDRGGYRALNDSMRLAAVQLRALQMNVEMEATDKFVSGSGLMGYYSWAKNDGSYDPVTFRRNTFKPGGIAETGWSFSAVTLRRNPEHPDWANIVDLVAGGATGVKGYVDEPYVHAVAVPNILFDRYTSGRNLAESFYAASRLICWRDIILGDPLCAPYATDEQNRTESVYRRQ
jgi:uncharacterized protein (TIGR03790 family)